MIDPINIGYASLGSSVFAVLLNLFAWWYSTLVNAQGHEKESARTLRRLMPPMLFVKLWFAVSAVVYFLVPPNYHLGLPEWQRFLLYADYLVLFFFLSIPPWLLIIKTRVILLREFRDGTRKKPRGLDTPHDKWGGWGG